MGRFSILTTSPVCVLRDRTKSVRFRILETHVFHRTRLGLMLCGVAVFAERQTVFFLEQLVQIAHIVVPSEAGNLFGGQIGVDQVMLDFLQTEILHDLNEGFSGVLLDEPGDVPGRVIEFFGNRFKFCINTVLPHEAENLNDGRTVFGGSGIETNLLRVGYG